MSSSWVKLWCRPAVLQYNYKLKQMEKFYYKNKLLGIRVRGFKNGVTSITEEHEPMQALAISKPAGSIIAPHKHKAAKRVTNNLQECLIVIKGSIRVDLFDDGKKVVKSVNLSSGDFFITISGAHSIKFLQKSEVFELKNGPFIHDRVDLFS